MRANQIEQAQKIFEDYGLYTKTIANTPNILLVGAKKAYFDGVGEIIIGNIFVVTSYELDKSLIWVAELPILGIVSVSNSIEEMGQIFKSYYHLEQISLTLNFNQTLQMIQHLGFIIKLQPLNKMQIYADKSLNSVSNEEISYYLECIKHKPTITLSFSDNWTLTIHSEAESSQDIFHSSLENVIENIKELYT